MLKSVFVAAAMTCAWSGAVSAAAPPANPAAAATAFVRTIIDKFNGGDTKGWVSAQENNTYIIDDFGPHVWTGSGSAQRWLDDYTKMAKEQGITGGRVDYEKPIAVNGDERSAYVVLPTTYRFVQNGTKMASPGSMTFIVKRHGKDWKIASWTYSGADPAAEK